VYDDVTLFMLSTHEGRFLVAVQALSTTKTHPLALTASKNGGTNWSQPLEVWHFPAGPVSAVHSGDSIVAVFEGSTLGEAECNHPYDHVNAVGACAIILVRVREQDVVLN
jgi:hypothetical protein